MNTISLFLMKSTTVRGKLKALGGEPMGLKFQREDSLDKMFDDFAFLPDNDKDKKKQENDIERFLKNESDEEKKTQPKDSKKAD
ncbi:hypothetical protein EY688_01355 [Enterococcus casseliflavus]|nr:hypothetical protein [Enterococcus casseliflavus]MBO6366004.1 hypothetical protein [Enterococcus casseliflavus]